MKLSFALLFVCAFPWLVCAYSPDPRETEVLAAAGYELIPDADKLRGLIVKNDREEELGITVAYRLNKVENLFKDNTGAWHRGRDARKGEALLSGKTYGSFAEVISDVAFSPLPVPPGGIKVRQVASFPAMPTRMTPDGQGGLLVLCRDASVWKVNLESGEKTLMYAGKEYVYADLGGDLLALGITLDQNGRLYVVTNQRDSNSVPHSNAVLISRTGPNVMKEPSPLKPWLRVVYPWAVSAFSHGVSHIAVGPDGYLYLNSGSRTNQGEAGEGGLFSTEGEVALTGCIWRLDPKAESPEIEIYARGLRNAYGFCWDDKGRMFATDNGPEKDAPEEFNIVSEGEHYGFPYEFSNWGGADDQPKKPEGLRTILPIPNIGPDGGGSPDKPLFTFDPHSCPAGIIYLDSRYPEKYRNTFFTVRFGSFKPEWPTGLDLLQIRLDESQSDKPTISVKQILSPIGRPLDICKTPDGGIYICESLRDTVIKPLGPGTLPGRVLELRFDK